MRHAASITLAASLRSYAPAPLLAVLATCVFALLRPAPIEPVALAGGG